MKTEYPYRMTDEQLVAASQTGRTVDLDECNGVVWKCPDGSTAIFDSETVKRMLNAQIEKELK